MDKSSGGDRDDPRGDEPEDQVPEAEDRNDHTESGEEESGSPPANDPETPPRTDEPLLNVALRPLTDTLEELVSVDATPPDAGRTEPGPVSRSTENSEGRSPRRDANARSFVRDVPSDEYSIEAQRTDDELIVIAELPDIEAEDLFIGLDEEERSLVVAVDDSVIAREFYPWESVEATNIHFDAPDLEVRLEPADATVSE